LWVRCGPMMSRRRRDHGRLSRIGGLPEAWWATPLWRRAHRVDQETSARCCRCLSPASAIGGGRGGGGSASGARLRRRAGVRERPGVASVRPVTANRFSCRMHRHRIRWHLGDVVHMVQAGQVRDVVTSSTCNDLFTDGDRSTAPSTIAYRVMLDLRMRLGQPRASSVGSERSIRCPRGTTQTKCSADLQACSTGARAAVVDARARAECSPPAEGIELRRAEHRDGGVEDAAAPPTGVGGPRRAGDRVAAGSARWCRASPGECGIRD